MFRTLFFVSGSISIGYVLYLICYWRHMGALVPLQYGVLDAEHILLILAIVGLILSLF